MFTSPGPELIQLGPLTLRWYGLLIALAVLIGLNLSSQLARSRQLENGLISDLLPLLVLTSVLGARVYYVAFEWRNYADQWTKALAIWEGGIAIHGALLAGSLTLILFCRWRRQPFWDVLDVLVPSVALGQAIGRWGNFFQLRGIRSAHRPALETVHPLRKSSGGLRRLGVLPSHLSLRIDLEPGSVPRSDRVVPPGEPKVASACLREH